MAINLRQRLVDAIMTRLQTITVANGYETNLGARVYEWRTTPLGADEMPGLIFRDTDEVIPQTGLVEEHEITLEIEMYASSGVATPATTRKAIADVIKCVGADVTFGGLAQDSVPHPEESIAFEHKDKIVGGVMLKFKVKYLSYRFDPYTIV